MKNDSTTSKTFSVGFAPASFPRDPVEVNQFHEHMFVGQVLEPIVDSDRFGQVKGGIGESWTFEDGGKKIVFKIASSRKFSNGRLITAKDVAYSIGRHLNTRSQSSLFLSDIKSIRAESDSKVIIELKSPNVAVIKALSRDQLGILPDGWAFDSKSDEPYVGSGPYRLVRKENQWRLIQNDHYPNKSLVRIKEWTIRKLEQGLNEIPEGELPDYIPSLAEMAMAQVKARSTFDAEKFEVKQNLTYAQTSFWIFPTSTFFKNAEARAKLASLLDSAIEQYALNKKFARANGLIPLGISGHNPQKVLLTPAAAAPMPKVLRVAYLKGAFTTFVESAEFKKFLAQAELKLELVPFEPTTLFQLKDKEIDLITGSWAGGYSDPTGFLGLLTPMLGMGFDTYLGATAKLLTQAKEESDWNKRAEKFKEFDRALVQSGLLIPGWQVPTFTVMKKPLRFEENQSRYTERFVNVTAQ